MSAFELQELRDGGVETRSQKLAREEQEEKKQQQPMTREDVLELLKTITAVDEKKTEEIKAAPRPPETPRSPKTSSLTTDVVWRSKCCNSKDGTEVSQSCLTFTLTSMISLIVLVFALYQLAFDNDDEDNSLTPLWISLVSSIGSLHLPSPLQNSATKK